MHGMISSLLFLLVFGLWKSFDLSVCVLGLSFSWWGFECLLGYDYQLPQSCSTKRVQLPPFGKTSSVGWISSFYANILIVETID